MVAPKAKPLTSKNTVFWSIGKSGPPLPGPPGPSSSSKLIVPAVFAVGDGGVGPASINETFNNIKATAKNGAFRFFIKFKLSKQQAIIINKYSLIEISHKYIPICKILDKSISFLHKSNI